MYGFDEFQPVYRAHDTRSLSEEFLTNGIVKIQVEDTGFLSVFKKTAEGNLPHLLSLNDTHYSLDNKKLNDFRLSAMKSINEIPEIRYGYYALAKSALHELVAGLISIGSKNSPNFLSA